MRSGIIWLTLFHWPIQYLPGPRNCQVSSWSEWGGCSVSCGIGESVRQRSVERRARNGGLACPSLREFKWCGSARNCKKGYFDWWWCEEWNFSFSRICSLFCSFKISFTLSKSFGNCNWNVKHSNHVNKWWTPTVWWTLKR